jgi:PAS domain S-box-containing protein
MAAGFIPVRNLPHLFGAAALSAFTLIAALGLTYAVWQGARNDAAETLQTYFDCVANETLDLVERRMTSFEAALRGVQGLASSAGVLQPAVFTRYFSAQHLDTDYPGLLGIGFLPASAPVAGKDTKPLFFVAHPAKEERGWTAAALNQLAIRYALDKARTTGKPVISDKLDFANGPAGGAESGFVMLLAIYGTDSAKVDAEKQRFLGWAYAPFRFDRLMAGLAGQHKPEVDFEIYDGNALAPSAAVYDDDGVLVGDNKNFQRLRSIRSVAVADHRWTLVASSLPPFDARVDRARPQFVTAIGVILSFMLALLTWLIMTGRAQALASAQAMNRELRESEEHFRTFFERSMVGMATINRHKSWIKVNDTLCGMLGYTRDELLHASWDELTHGEDVVVDGEHFRRLIVGEIDTYAMDKRFLHKDGRVIYTRLSVRSVRNEGDAVDYVMVQIEDITEEKAARDRDHLLISALEAVGNCVIITDPDSTVEWVNQAFEKLTGYRREEAVGRR